MSSHAKYQRGDVVLLPIAFVTGAGRKVRPAVVLQNDNVAAALVGASRPEQVADNVKAAGVKLDADVMSRIDDALGSVVVRDPGKTAEGMPKTRVV